MILLTNPVASDYQVSFNGLLMGPGTAYGITSYAGLLDLAGVRAVYTNRPHKNGAFYQPHYAGGAVFDLTMDVTANGSTAFVDAVAALQAAAVVTDTAQILSFKLPGRPALGVNVQCLRRAIPVATGFEFGLAEKAAIQFYAADPRMYGVPTTTQVGLRTGGTGLAYSLAYSLDYGATPAGGRVTFTNTGSAPTEPLITVSGPFASGFSITHNETGRALVYSATVGSDLVLDCNEGTVLTQGQDRAANLTQRDWFTVAAGASATFSLATLGSETAASAPTAGMTVSVAPAYS